MKKVGLLIIAGNIILLASCAPQRTCPTYIKNIKIKETEKPV